MYDTIYFDGYGDISLHEKAVYYRIIYSDTNDLDLYYVQDYHITGQPEMTCAFSSMNPFKKEIVGFYSVDSKGGNAKHGLCKKYYEDGSIMIKCNYSDNKPNGVVEYYHRNGEVLARITYDNGIRNGEFTQWYSNGSVSRKGEFRNNKEFGEWISYDKEAKIINQKTYPENKIREVVHYDYLSYLPEDYEKSENRKYPVLIFLHGSGPSVRNIKVIENNGIHKIITRNSDSLIVIVPFCPGQWTDNNWIDSLLIDVSNEFRINKQRIYLTGISKGAHGTLDAAVRNPHIFAAIAPLSGAKCDTFTLNHIERLKDTPIWAFSGIRNNSNVIRGFEEWIVKLKKVSNNVKYTRYTDLAHVTWERTYTNPEFYNWLLKQSK